MILLDTSGLLAAIDASQNQHSDAAKALLAADPPLLLSPFVLSELDYLLGARVGIDAELALLDEVAAGAYQLEPFDAVDVSTARDHVRQYRSIDLGLADASIIVLENRHGASDVLTLDELTSGRADATGYMQKHVPTIDVLNSATRSGHRSMVTG